MDRNPLPHVFGGRAAVALRKESVDRNPSAVVIWRSKDMVALRKESVDRNTLGITAS